MARNSGRTTVDANLRQAPSGDARILATLRAGTPIELVGSTGNWLEVVAAGRRGFIYRKLVLLADDEVSAGLLAPGLADPTSWLSTVALEPAAARRIVLASAAPAAQRTVARIWNGFGGILERLATELKLDPGVAVAVLAVESSGTGFRDGRMIIRFENHHFDKYWGAWHAAVFRSHFRYGDKPWLEHAWRANAKGRWLPVHTDQSSEWACFDHACTLDPHAARLAISMGSPQILGSNHAAIGYDSVEAMFDAFSAGDRAQIVGLFDFVKGTGTASAKVLALQEHDFDTFAGKYNGPANAARYGATLQSFFTAFQAVGPASSMAPAA